MLLICFLPGLRINAQAETLSQRPKRPAIIQLSAGFSETMNSNDPGFTLSYVPLYYVGGISAQLGIIKPVAKYFDALLTLHYSNFNIDSLLYESMTNSMLQTGYGNTNLSQSSKRVSMGMQLGCNATFPLLDEGRLRFEGGVQIGLARLLVPQYSVSITYTSDPSFPKTGINYEPAKSGNLIPTASFNMGLRYNLKKYLSFSLQFEYMKLLSEIHYNLNMSVNPTLGAPYSVVQEITEGAGWSYTNLRLGVGWLIFR